MQLFSFPVRIGSAWVRSSWRMSWQQLPLGLLRPGPVQWWGQGTGHCLERRRCSKNRGETDPVWERTEKRDPVQLMCLVHGWTRGAVIPSWIASWSFDWVWGNGLLLQQKLHCWNILSTEIPALSDKCQLGSHSRVWNCGLILLHWIRAEKPSEEAWLDFLPLLGFSVQPVAFG